MSARRLTTILMKFIALALSVLLVASLAWAHDFWLAASPWHLKPGDRITITANVGERFPLPTSFTSPDRIQSLEVIGPTGKRLKPTPFRKADQSLAADVVLPSTAGTYLVAMTVKPRFIQLQPDQFAEYLRHEGLEWIVDDRTSREEENKPGRERYSRYAKLLIRTGNGSSNRVTKPTGLKAELVPDTDPTSLNVGGTLGLRLLHEGRPVEGALVGAVYATWSGDADNWP
ncbi:MAG: DUF4198 domain-containing protein, partial [Acidimicrobiia bacterium]